MTRGTADGPDPDLLRAYLSEIARYRLLTRDDEVILARTIEAGVDARAELADGSGLSATRRAQLRRAVRAGDVARPQFVQANLRLVVSIARRYRGSGLPLLDLIQEGNLGLLRAVEKFDWRRGFKFSTYATWWIRQAISRGIASSSRSIRLPQHTVELVSRVRQAAAELEVSLQRRPRPAEIAAACGLEARVVAGAQRVSVPTASLNDLVGDGDGELGELVSDPDALDPGEEAVRSLLPGEVERLLAVLDDRERAILCLRFGLDGGDPRTLEEVGIRFAVTRERVRQIESRAMTKVRLSAGADGSGLLFS